MEGKVWAIGWGVLGICLGCSAGDPPAQGGLGTVGQAVVNVDQFLYLRCNATGWDIKEANRLLATSTANVFSLTYAVPEQYMVTGSDQCILTLTNQLDGWGSSQTTYSDRSPSTSLAVPKGDNLVASSANFNVKYPALGNYTIAVNWAAQTFNIAAAVSCTPLSVAAACGAHNCGTASNGCGGAISCGTCTGATPTCSSSTGAGTCSCTPLSVSQACGADNCGAAPNGCGGVISCGTCTGATPTCSSSTGAGTCSCTPLGVSQACGADNCGTAPNGCGGVISCGTCTGATPTCSSSTGAGTCH